MCLCVPNLYMCTYFKGLFRERFRSGTEYELQRIALLVVQHPAPSAAQSKDFLLRCILN